MYICTYENKYTYIIKNIDFKKNNFVLCSVTSAVQLALQQQFLICNNRRVPMSEKDINPMT